MEFFKYSYGILLLLFKKQQKAKKEGGCDYQKDSFLFFQLCEKIKLGRIRNKELQKRSKFNNYTMNKKSKIENHNVPGCHNLMTILDTIFLI